MDGVPSPSSDLHPLPSASNPILTQETTDAWNPSSPRSVKKRIKNNKKKKKLNDGPDASSSSSPSHLPHSSDRGMRVLWRRPRPRVLFGAGRSPEPDVDAIALPLGMSFAAVVAQVLQREDTVQEKMSVDYISQICNSAVRESLSNVFGNKFSRFVNNFEKSFGSTLRTLRLIGESSLQQELHQLDQPDCTFSSSDMSPCGFMVEGDCSSTLSVKECQTDTVLHQKDAEEHLSMLSDAQEHLWRDSMIHDSSLKRENNQLACISRCRSGAIISNPVRSTFEKSVMEQTRSNDLKELELGLAVKKMKLKEVELSLTYDANHLERSKLAMGISKASFKAEKFKNELEDARYAELLKKCIDCLVAGLIIMSLSLAYGAYVFSYQRISEATESCAALAQESRSWWIPVQVASFNSGLQILRCQVQVLSRMLFGVLMILAIAYLLLQRSTTSNQTMPVTFLLLLLGVACGFAGKFCVDTLGGNGYHWLIFWETLCLVHFLTNIWTSGLFTILHGPISVSQGMKKNVVMIPYWLRRVLFYAIVLVFLPLLCGLIPFGSPVEWKDHVLQLIVDSSTDDGDWN